MSVIDKIFSILDEKGISQREFAEKLGITKSIVSDWKSGRVHSYQKYINQIAALLNTTTSYLLGETEQKEKPTEIGEPSERQKQINDIMGDLDKLPPDLYERAIDYLKYLVANRK